MIKKLLKNMKGTHKLLNETDLIPEVHSHLNAVVKLDANGKILSYNQAFANQYRYDEQDSKKSFFDLFFKYQSSEMIGYFEDALLGKAQKWNTLGVANDGKSVEVMITLLPNRKKKDIFVILKDITEFKSQQQELNHYKVMDKTFNQVDAICNFYYDAINDLLYFSDQITDILKINPKDEFKPSLNQFLRYVHPDDAEELKNAIETSMSEKKSVPKGIPTCT